VRPCSERIIRPSTINGALVSVANREPQPEIERGQASRNQSSRMHPPLDSGSSRSPLLDEIVT
jgi:hypothetical protein